MITCPKCGAINKPGASLCRMCATPFEGNAGDTSSKPEQTRLAAEHKPKQEATNSVQPEGITCPECNTTNEVGWSFCQQCGKRLPEPSAAAKPGDDRKPAEGFKTVASDQLLKQGIAASEMKTEEEEAPVEPPLAATIITEAKRPPVPLIKPAARNAQSHPRVEPPPPGAASSPANPQASAKPAEPLKPPISGVFCTQCGQTNNAGSQYCASCGAPIAKTQTMVMSSPVAPPRGRLCLVMEGGQQGDVYDLSDETVIGRTAGEITFPHDGFMSGRHARVARRGGGFVLVDEGSRNGTFIKIKGEVELKPGDMILIGKQLFRFET